MAGTRRAGGIRKRCECRGEDGKRLGTSCSQLKRRSHGSYQLQQELPPADGVRRRIFRRTGYGGVKEAQGDLDKVRALLDLAGDDEHYAQQIGDLLAKVQRDRAPIPDTAEVQRRLAGGVALHSTMTVGEWLDIWLAAKKAKRRTLSAYESHIRVHIKPALGRYRLDKLNVGHVQAMFDGIDTQNETIRVENQQRGEQQERCRWRPGTKGGRPAEKESERLAAERARLAKMPPFRKETGAATQQRIRATLRTALNAAIRKQMITFNPAQWVELAPGKRPMAQVWTPQSIERWKRTGEKPSPVMEWTPPQLGEFLDEAESSRLYALYYLVAFRGPRRGEMVGHDRSDTDLDGKVITIRRNLVLDKGEVFEDTPKTEEAMATIALDSLSVAVLRAHRERQVQEREAWNRHAAAERAKGRDVHDWVDTGKEFTRPDGTWLNPDEVSDEFRRIYERAGLPPINLRDLRHLAGKLVHTAGRDIHAVKRVLRHANIRLTSDTYTGLDEDVDRDIAEKAATLVPRARRAVEDGPAEGAEGGDVSAG